MKFDLYQARTHARFSQEEIAKKLGIAKLTYQHYEHGDRKMRVDVAEKFAKEVGIPMRQIIF